MANVNIPDLTALTAPATADVIEVYDDSAAQNKRLALSYLVRADGNGPQITGGGTIALGGYTLTVPATGTAALLGTRNAFATPSTWGGTSLPQAADFGLSLTTTTNSGKSGIALLTTSGGVFYGGAIYVEHVSSYRANLNLIFSGDASGQAALKFEQFSPSANTVYERARINYAGHFLLGTTTDAGQLAINGDIAIVDGMTAPSATVGFAKIYVDSADGDLKIKFGDGTIKTIVTDT